MLLEDRHVTATPEGVSLSLIVAGFGSRFAAYLIDVVIQATIFAILVLAILVLHISSSETSYLIDDGAGFLTFALCFVGSFILSEMLWSGRSLGKMAIGLRVVRIDGSAIGFWSSLLRNILRIGDWLPSLYLVGSVLILATNKHQRLGDFVADTMVIREKTALPNAVPGSLGWTDPRLWTRASTRPSYLVPLPEAWRNIDVTAVSQPQLTLIHQFLQNRYGYSPMARARLASMLAQDVATVVFDGGLYRDPELFLEMVAYQKARGQPW